MRAQTGSRPPRRLGGLAGLAAVAALALAAPAHAEGRLARAGTIAWDIFPIRTLAAAQTVVGAALFVPAALFSYWGPVIATGSFREGKTTFDEAWDIFVLEPAERAFIRPLGAF